MQALAIFPKERHWDKTKFGNLFLQVQGPHPKMDTESAYYTDEKNEA